MFFYKVAEASADCLRYTESCGMIKRINGRMIERSDPCEEACEEMITCYNRYVTRLHPIVIENRIPRFLCIDRSVYWYVQGSC